ncbi:MAG: hypothetical protein QG628_196 [Patescibacteria group bacterium]|nr:hypothetical protein [Patescibacteria group bacterium]
MQQSVFILGRQPALALAELESLFGADNVRPVSDIAAIVNSEPKSVTFNRIGGSIKLAGMLTELQTTDWNKIMSYIEISLPKHLTFIPEGKLKLGISVFGLRVDYSTINRSALSLKKIVKASGRSVRVVPNNEPALNSAQVIHNQLTSNLGLELLIIRNGDATILAQTIAEQDIESYAARDQKRPMRDARVGMLPPKLAQVIVNCAVGTMQSEDPLVILDPFCGTGVILQEAGLMGYSPYGTDFEERMVRYSRDNMNWLQEKWSSSFDWHLEVGDATNMQWRKPLSAIACETYLGRPFSVLPDDETLEGVMKDVNLILKRFLQNVATQTATGFPLCIAVPAWKTPNGFKHLKMLDSLEVLGYTRRSFVHAETQDLIYFREGQVVGRELVVLKRT